MVQPEIIKEWDTQFGHIESGRILDENRGVTIPYWLGTPFQPVVDDWMAAKTGLTADLESLRKFTETALALGVGVLTVGHRHNDVRRSIRSNSMDYQYAVDGLLEESVPLHGVGLSRGWAGVLLAAKHLPGRFDSITAVAPAMMAPIRPTRLWKAGAELAVQTARNPRDFGRVLLDSVQTTRSRFGVTISESAKLSIGGYVHDRVRALQGDDQGLQLHLVASKDDCFFDPDEMKRIAEELGFNSYTLFCQGSAGHSALSYDGRLCRSVIATAIEALPNRESMMISRDTEVQINPVS